LSLDDTDRFFVSIDVVNGSTVCLNYLPVADGNSHELVTVLNEGVPVDWIFSVLGFVQPSVSAISFIGILLFLYLSEVIKFIEGGLSDRNHLFYNIPKDTLRAWNSGQRALIGPSSIELEQFNEFC